MALGVRAISDIVFKYIFGTEESTEILKAFINALLTDAGYPAVSDLKVVNPFNAKTYIDDKVSIIDTRAKAYAEQLPEGHEDRMLHRVISISIVDAREKGWSEGHREELEAGLEQGD